MKAITFVLLVHFLTVAWVTTAHPLHLLGYVCATCAWAGLSVLTFELFLFIIRFSLANFALLLNLVTRTNSRDTSTDDYYFVSRPSTRNEALAQPFVVGFFMVIGPLYFSDEGLEMIFFAPLLCLPWLVISVRFSSSEKPRSSPVS